MNVLQESEKLLAAMTPPEKAQLLQRIVDDLGNAFPGIDSRPEVCGGVPCPVLFERVSRFGLWYKPAC